MELYWREEGYRDILTRQGIIDRCNTYAAETFKRAEKSILFAYKADQEDAEKVMEPYEEGLGKLIKKAVGHNCFWDLANAVRPVMEENIKKNLIEKIEEEIVICERDREEVERNKSLIQHWFDKYVVVEYGYYIVDDYLADRFSISMDDDGIICYI